MERDREPFLEFTIMVNIYINQKKTNDLYTNKCFRESAKEYYEKAHHIDGLMDSLYHLEQYEELEGCVQRLPEKSPLLGKLGQMLSSVGMCNQAVAAYLKMGDVKSAVNTCVSLKQWGQAVELAQKYKMPQIGALLEKHASHLLQEGRLPEAVELQRKAGRYMMIQFLLVFYYNVKNQILRRCPTDDETC